MTDRLTILLADVDGIAAMDEVPVLVLAGIVVGVGTIPLRPLVGVFPCEESSSPELLLSVLASPDLDLLTLLAEVVRVAFLPLRARPIVSGIMDELDAFLDFLDPLSLPLLEVAARSERPPLLSLDFSQELKINK